jgi:hypothetical protein
MNCTLGDWQTVADYLHVTQGDTDTLKKKVNINLTSFYMNADTCELGF